MNKSWKNFIIAIALLISFCLPQISFAAVKVGKVVSVTGKVTGDHGILKKDDDFFENELIVTDKKSTIQLKLTDGTSVLLPQKTRYKMEKYQQRPDGMWNKVTMLYQGGLRSRTQHAPDQKPSEYVIKTPASSVKVKGTFLSLYLPGCSNTGNIPHATGTSGCGSLEATCSLGKCETGGKAFGEGLDCCLHKAPNVPPTVDNTPKVPELPPLPPEPTPPTQPPQPPADKPQPPADKPQPPADKPQPRVVEPKPPADKPPADKPPADKPPADKPPADKPPADKPPTDKPQPPADKPQPPADKPQPPADKPQPPADKPQPPADKPQPPADKPQPPADKPQPPADKPHLPKPPHDGPRAPNDGSKKPPHDGPKPHQEGSPESPPHAEHDPDGPHGGGEHCPPPQSIPCNHWQVSDKDMLYEACSGGDEDFVQGQIAVNANFSTEVPFDLGAGDVLTEETYDEDQPIIDISGRRQWIWATGRAAREAREIYDPTRDTYTSMAWGEWSDIRCIGIDCDRLPTSYSPSRAVWLAGVATSPEYFPEGTVDYDQSLGMHGVWDASNVSGSGLSETPGGTNSVSIDFRNGDINGAIAVRDGANNDWSATYSGVLSGSQAVGNLDNSQVVIANGGPTHAATGLWGIMVSGPNGEYAGNSFKMVDNVDDSNFIAGNQVLTH